MSEETKPTTIPEPTPAVVEPTPAPVVAETTEAATEEKPTEAAAPVTTEEPAKAEEIAAAEEPKKEVEPIFSGTLKYVTGPTIKALFQKPLYNFHFGEEPVKVEELKHTVRLQEESGRHTAAWSNETGKGVLYFVRDTANKAGPPGALLLHAIEELKAQGTDKFDFKLHGTKHTFIAANSAERDGWLKAFEIKIQEAKDLKDDIVNRDSYKESLEKLLKPIPVVAAATPAAKESVPKKSVEERDARTETKKDAKKDRSQSRGKKFLDSIRGKKEAKADEAEAEETKVDETAPVLAAPVVAAEESTEAPAAAATEETPVVTPTEEPKTDAKKDRRSSKLFQAFRFGSGSSEKKTEEVAPTTVATEEPAKVEEPVAPVEDKAIPEPAPVAAEPASVEEPAATETAPVEEAAPAEKTARRRSVFDALKSLNKPKKAEEPKKTEEAAPVVAAAEEPTETPAAVEPVSEGETPKKQGLVDLIRSKSKAFRSSSKKPSKTAEATEETKAEEAAAPAAEEPAAAPAVEEPAKTEEPVVADVPTTTAPPASATVAATA